MLKKGQRVRLISIKEINEAFVKYNPSNKHHAPFVNESVLGSEGTVISEESNGIVEVRFDKFMRVMCNEAMVEKI